MKADIQKKFLKTKFIYQYTVMQIHISKWRASISIGWLKIIWLRLEHFTRRLIYYEHDS